MDNPYVAAISPYFHVLGGVVDVGPHPSRNVGVGIPATDVDPSPSHDVGVSASAPKALSSA